jgi:hypothetical protein
MPRSCVNCGTEWEAPHTQYVNETFQKLREAMQTAQSIADGRKIAFSLELKEEPKT